MDETQDGEKLLRSPLDEPELVSGSIERPSLRPEELVKTTPEHELKNLFGMSPDETLRPLNGKISENQSSMSEFVAPNVPSFPFLPKKEVKSPASLPPKPKPTHSIRRFFIVLFLAILILATALYFWGGVLKEQQGVTSDTTKLSL